MPIVIRLYLDLMIKRPMRNWPGRACSFEITRCTLRSCPVSPTPLSDYSHVYRRSVGEQCRNGLAYVAMRECRALRAYSTSCLRPLAATADTSAARSATFLNLHDTCPRR